MNRSFGHSLKQMREALSFSQEQLANELGSTQRHISFLETGRSMPTRAMLGRIVTALNLTHAQRAALFAASGFHNPYGNFTLDSVEVQEALDVIEARILRHWPFPAFALDAAWNILRANEAAIQMLAPFLEGEPGNLLSVFISPAFSSLIENWEEVSTSFYFRTVSAAEKSETLRVALRDARRRGIFDHIPSFLTETDQVPVYTPARLKLPDGSQVELTSAVATLAASHDHTMAGIEIEMMFPLDDTTDSFLRGQAANAD